jgi:tRNA(Ile)-lysidine synthase
LEKKIIIATDMFCGYIYNKEGRESTKEGGLMYKTILEFIRRNRLLLPGDRVIVAFSGGADSVCLLVILNELKDELGISLKAVHVHHGLRGQEADRDSEYAKELAMSLSLPFSCAHVDVTGYAREHRLSVEEAGRHLRYEILEQERLNFGGNKIAVAHHKDDQAETILYHLFRGTGLKGLGGIRPERDRIVRPLLSIGKGEILAYLEEKGISYCEDSTNSHHDYARNRIRGILLPIIKEQINARAADNIIHAGEMAARADEYLEKQAQGLLKEWGSMERDENDVLISSGIQTKGLISEEDILVTYVIRAMIRMVLGSMKDISMIHVESTKALLDSPAGKQIDLPGGVIAYRSLDSLWIKNKNKKEAVDNPLENILPNVDFKIFPYKKGQEIPENGYTKWFDYDKIKCALSVRYRQTGDYMTLTGGGRKTVKAFMIDEKIPKEDREKIPLIVEGSHVLWVIGYRISEYYKITDDTHTVIQMQLDGGKDNG